jgi:hypothetical protein
MDNPDDEYADIVEKLDYAKPGEYIEELRKLAGAEHRESMNLLAVLLGDIDNTGNRGEIISLYERAFELGSPVAAKNLAIQYHQWGEPELASVWQNKAIVGGAGR